MIDAAMPHPYHSCVEAIDEQKLERYRTLISGLDPSGPPKAIYLSPPASDPGPSRCLVLDAAFNPPTVAHWSLAQQGKTASGADRILLQLAAANVDKGVSGADLGQRLYMLDALAAVDSSVSVSICSHARFVDKAIALEALAPQTTHIFAIGYDTLIRLFDPKYYDDMDSELEAVFGKAEFAVANRADNDPQSLAAYLDRPPQSTYSDRIHQVTLPGKFAHVSSSEIRERIGSDGDVGEWVAPDVLRIISQMRLYKD